MSGPEILTFGCRLNTVESEIIRRRADEAGLADAVIVNTCAVTAEAERQARQAIRRARREHASAISSAVIGPSCKGVNTSSCMPASIAKAESAPN